MTIEVQGNGPKDGPSELSQLARDVRQDFERENKMYVYLVGKEVDTEISNKTFVVLSIFSTPEKARKWLESDNAKSNFPWWFRDSNPIIREWNVLEE